MGNKHHTLSETEYNSYNIDSKILNQIHLYIKENPNRKKEDIRILDWGCGRGKAVLKLLDEGFKAFGVDIDSDTMENGYSLFREKGFDPEKVLIPVSSLANFPEEYFQFIFSEQVFEHVEHIEEVIELQSRFTSHGGFGCHVFPSSKMVRECHLNMPFVHWLPKNSMRKFWIAVMVSLSQKPETLWPEVKGKSFWEEVKVYYNYLNNKTFYRDNRKLKKLFNENGLKAEYIIRGIDSFKRKYIPNFLLHNGFPDQQVYFLVKKPKVAG